MADVLVTGGAGFIGSHVADVLIARGHDVVVFDDLSGGAEVNVPRHATFVRGSIADPAAVDDLFSRRRFAFVFHLAAYAAEGLSHFIKRFNYTNNLIGSVNLINASVNTGVTGFVFTSSIAVYGASPHLPMTEDTFPHPDDPYGIAKLRRRAGTGGLPERCSVSITLSSGPTTCIGPRQNIADRYRNVIGIFMNQILQGRSR